MTRMPDEKAREVIVVGAGVTGLAAAWRLREASADVLVLEADGAVGGCMRTERRDGFLLEKGPFNVLVRDEAFRQLLDSSAGEVRPCLASEKAQQRFLLRHGALHQVPMGPGGLLRTPLLSGPAKARLLRGMLLSRRSPVDEPTIFQAAERRLGREVAETFISSIVAGVFGGDSRALSLKACFPKAWHFDRERRSPLLYEMQVLRRRKRDAQRSGPPRYKGLVSFEHGLQALPDHIARMLGGDLVTGCRVERVERTSTGYALTARLDGVERRYTCRRLVLAVPKQAAAALLTPLAPDAAAALDAIETASLVVLNLGYRRADVGHPMEGYGFLVPQTERDMPVMGVLWADSAFPHHAAGDRRLIRVFMGGPRDPHATQRPDSELLDVATGAIGGLLHLRKAPILVDVCRWPNAIPQYRVGHEDLVRRLDDATGHLPHLHLAGNYRHGVSINDCIRDGAALGDAIAGAIAAEVRGTLRSGDARPAGAAPPSSATPPARPPAHTASSAR